MPEGVLGRLIEGLGGGANLDISLKLVKAEPKNIFIERNATKIIPSHLIFFRGIYKPVSTIKNPNPAKKPKDGPLE